VGIEPGSLSHEGLVALVMEQATVIAELRAENAELRRRLGMNSSNSSRPPSADGLAKPKRSSGSPSGRRPGKQPGAASRTLELVENPDHVLVHRPDRCAGCTAGLGQAAVFARSRRQVVDLPNPRVVVTEHQILVLRCACGHVTAADAPDGVTGRVQYGPGVKAAAAYARGRQFLPYARAAAVLADLCAAKVSPGFVYAVLGEAARRLAPFMTRVRALLREQAVLHADETPARCEQTWKYVHVAATETLTAFHVGGRSAADIDAGGILPGFTGTLVRDGYAGYQHLSGASHAWCGAHLLRDLRSVHEADPEHQLWAVAMATTLLEAKTLTEAALAAGRNALTEAELRHIRSAYAGAIAYGRTENPPDATGERRARVLIERFATHRDMILRFTVDLAVAFTNNQAERDVRPVKLQQKISGCWRTLQGLHDFAVVRSYLTTATKHGLDNLDVLRQLFTTGPWLPPPTTSS
jgi:transposase